MIVWVDETGCVSRNALRKYGYGLRGMPPQDFALKLRGKRYSAIGILTTGGIEDVYITEGSVNGKVFFDFVRKCLLPVLMSFNGINQNSIVILDNASIHHVDYVVEAILSIGAPFLCKIVIRTLHMLVFTSPQTSSLAATVPPSFFPLQFAMYIARKIFSQY
jgi:hypothetical protein